MLIVNNSNILYNEMIDNKYSIKLTIIIVQITGRHMRRYIRYCGRTEICRYLYFADIRYKRMSEQTETRKHINNVLL